MNKKLAKGALAGVAALALAAGGTTFAAWSDFSTITGNQIEAGHLVLNVPNSSGPISNVGIAALAPGEYHTIDYFLTSADLDGVPKADLSMVVKNLQDQENGCSSASESIADPTCAAANDPGELSGQAYMRVRYSDPVAINGGSWNPSLHECTAPLVHGVGAASSDNDTTHYPRLSSLTTAVPLGELTAGQGVCVRIDVGLDPNATNAVQGDSSTFDLQFDLNQAF